MITSTGAVAIVIGTCIIVVTFNSFVVACSIITRFGCAFTVIITRMFSMIASRGRVTSVISTEIIIIAIYGDLSTSMSKIATVS